MIFSYIYIILCKFRVIAIDLRGCGDSEYPTKRGGFSKEILVQDIASLITTLGRFYIYTFVIRTFLFLL